LEFLNAYYNKDKGIGYSLIRTNMSSFDFSSDMYDYVKEGDKSLNSFSIAQYKKFKIPLIQKAMKSIGKDASFFISPWSPPAFMKDNKSKLQGGKLLPKFQQSWEIIMLNI
jgi:glucosylceramidase